MFLNFAPSGHTHQRRYRLCLNFAHTPTCTSLTSSVVSSRHSFRSFPNIGEGVCWRGGGGGGDWSCDWSCDLVPYLIGQRGGTLDTLRGFGLHGDTQLFDDRLDAPVVVEMTFDPTEKLAEGFPRQHGERRVKVHR